MNRTSPYPSSTHSRGARSLFGALEWEELPSLAGSLRHRELGFAGSVWTATQRMELFDYDDAQLLPLFRKMAPARKALLRRLAAEEAQCQGRDEGYWKRLKRMSA